MLNRKQRRQGRKLAAVEAAIEKTVDRETFDAIGQLGRLVFSIDEVTIRAIRVWDMLLDHPNSNIRREAYQQLEQSITAGNIPEELGDLFEDTVMNSHA